MSPNLDHNEVHTNDQTEDVVQIQTEFELQCETSLPPDPSLTAQSLFKYWEEYLNFYEHIAETNDDTFAAETINELSI